MYKKIVFATDFSKINENVLDKVCSIIKMNEAFLVLCHVSQIALVDPTYETGFTSADVLEDKEYVQQEVTIILDQFISRGVTNLKFVTDASFDIAHTITHDVYEKEHNDLIILVKHQKAGLSRFLGNHLSAIAKSAPTDVLIIKE